MQEKYQPILNVLLKKGLLQKAQLEEARKEAEDNQRDLKNYLLETGKVKEIDWLQAQAVSLGISYVELEGNTFDSNVLRVVPEESIRRYRFIPYKKEGEVLYIGMVDPNNIEAQEAIRFIATKEGFKPEIALISEAGFKHALKQYEDLRGRVEKVLEDVEKEEVSTTKKAVIKAEPIAAEAPISKVVAVIVRHATESQASDIHIEPLENTVRVRFRVDGILHTSLFLKKEVHQSIVSRVKILSRMKIDETRVPQDGRFNAKIDEKRIDFRVSILPTGYGEKVVMRILDPAVGISSLGDLGITGRSLEVINEAIKSPYGMIIASGPTGSGKTTTLYTILNILNQEAVNIISLEDPIEYFIEGVNQSQVRPEINYSFGSGLRSILRQDPDIILVGEIRDDETASLATHAALTGHLLLSTVHTKNAVGIIPRLTDMGVQRFLLPSTLSIGLAQRLARRLCPDCKERYTPSEKIQEMVVRELKSLPEQYQEGFLKESSVSLYKSKGCKLCGHTGTRGRIGVYEVLEMTPELEEIILTEPTESRIFQEAKRQGMITMFQDGVIKALKGVVSIEEVIRVAREQL